MQSGRCPGAIRIPLTVIVRPAHAGSPAAHGDIVVVRRLRVRDGCARMRNETEERRAMDTPESYGLCISARRRMRRIGHAVVPAVACTVIDAPCAPGQAAVGWRRSPDRCAPAALPNARCAAPRRAPRAPPAGKKKKAPRPPAGGTGGGGICQWTPVRAYVPGVVARLRCRDAGIGVTVARSGRCAVVVDADDAPDVVPAIRLRRSSRSAPPSPPRAACSASRTPICRARCGAASTPHPPARRRRCASSSTPGATRSGSMTTGASSSPTPGADDAPARAAPPPPPALRP